MILLVEDERPLAESLARFLTTEGGYTVRLAHSAAQAASALDASIRLVILDWGLPDGSGLTLLRSWRAAGQRVPVIFLTARAELVDKVLGLEGGASDYVTKPFEPRELLARVRAQLRDGSLQGPLSYSQIVLNPETRQVTYQGRPISLVHLEYELLKRLLEFPERVFSRAELLDEVWGYENYPTTRTVDFHIAQLRQKIAAELFESVRGVGYRLRAGIPT